jgi:ribose/xylose/arabinose/galactoside ABC-type transport system permease subunit
MDNSAVSVAAPERTSLRTHLSRHSSLVTFISLALLLTILTHGAALSVDSVQNLVVAEAVRAFAALGVGMIIITRGIDLSIGSVVGLAASVAASFAQTADYSSALYPGHVFPLWLPILAGIATGALFGLLNGALVAYSRLPAFIATLGTMSIAHGCQLIYTHAASVGSLRPDYKVLAQGSWGPVPNLAIFAFIAALAVWMLLRFFRQGTYFYAIGGNEVAAKVSGINVNRQLILVYTYAGILYGIGGCLLAARIGLADALSGQGMELDAIAAVTVGGVSQSGGVGTVSGMMLGVLTLGIINYGMAYMGIDSYFQLLIKGMIILIAVYFDMRKYKRR